MVVLELFGNIVGVWLCALLGFSGNLYLELEEWEELCFGVMSRYLKKCFLFMSFNYFLWVCMVQWLFFWRAWLLEMCFRHSCTLCLVAWGSVDERHETHSNTSLYCIFGSYLLELCNTLFFSSIKLLLSIQKKKKNVLELCNLKDWLFCSPSIPLAYTGVSFLINKISL